MSLENQVSSVEDSGEEEFVDELKPETQLMHGQYTIEGFLAAGGFGITYLARDSLNRRVVVKECFPGNFCRRQNASVMPRSRAHQSELSSIVRMFSQEAMSLAKANHPNIVGVHQVFEENNTAYMALDFVQGRDLLEILNEDHDSLTPELVESYLTKVLGAIQHIHDLGMLHRDISPDNIIINEDGEPILIDFGAAREESSTDERVTRMLSALRVVKDGYSPQEFYIAGSTQTPSCDLYSLAASFYHIITGDLPPDSQSRLSARAANDVDPYISLGDRVDGYSKSFVSALDKAMNILPPDRMQSANEWLDHMQNAPAPEAEKTISVGQKPLEQSGGKKPILPILIGTTALVAAGVGFVMFSGGSDDTVTDPFVSPPVASAPTTTTEVGTLTTDVDAPPVPTAEGQIAAAPSVEDSAPQTPPAQPSPDLTVAANGQEDTQPTVDKVGPPRTVQTNTAALDFFMSLDKDEPALSTARSQPTAASPADVAQPTAPVTEPVVATSDDITSVVAQFLPQAPFVLSDSQPGMVVAVAVSAPDWLEENIRITGINGETVTTNGQINQQLQTLASQVDTSAFDAEITFERGDGTTFERVLSIPMERQTLLVNGLKFVTRETSDGVWSTQVIETPEVSNFRVGDTLVSFTANWEELNGPNSLQDILERELSNGASSFSFVVRRDGEIWVEVFELAS